MFNPKTVFVIGAGAGAEINMPTGLQLAEIISEKLNLESDDFGRWAGKGDQIIFEDIARAFPKELNEYLRAAAHIRDGIILSKSVDNFIDSHRNNPLVVFCGKLAIVRSILEAEEGSALYYERRSVSSTIDFRSIENTWFIDFLRILNEDIIATSTLDSIFDNITIINFNYDRCLEHLLLDALPVYFDIPYENAWKLLKKLKIYHPYGVVAPFASPKIQPPLNGLDFGRNFRVGAENIVHQIKTYTEQIEEDDLLKQMRSEMQQAKKIVFLGFGFHKQNMNLIKPEGPTEAETFYATRFGISDGDLPVICRRIYSLRDLTTNGRKPIPDDILFASGKSGCKQLFRDYGLSLSRL